MVEVVDFVIGDDSFGGGECSLCLLCGLYWKYLVEFVVGDEDWKFLQVCCVCCFCYQGVKGCGYWSQVGEW